MNRKVQKFIVTLALVGTLGSCSFADAVVDVSDASSTGKVAIDNNPVINEQASDGSIKVVDTKKLSVERIAGKNRYETSYKISEELGEYKNIVIASGEDFPDALSSGILASYLKSPVILTEKNSVNPYLYSALNTHKNQKYYVIGGKSSISEKVMEDIKHFSPDLTSRISGKDRYETAGLVTSKIIREIYNSYGYPDNLAVYDGSDFADAMSATPFMYQYERNKEKEKPVTVPLPKGYKIDHDKLEIVFGGESFLPKGNEKLRLAGSNRYKTSVEVAKAFKTVLNKDIDTVIIASGEDYPDALSAGPLASSKNAAILLTEAKGLNPDVKKYIEETKSIKNVIIVGGESTVSAQVEKDLATIAR